MAARRRVALGALHLRPGTYTGSWREIAAAVGLSIGDTPEARRGFTDLLGNLGAAGLVTVIRPPTARRVGVVTVQPFGARRQRSWTPAGPRPSRLSPPTADRTNDDSR